MRKVICYNISLLVAGLVLVGCGQSGTLHMPNDPNYDKRAKYLLYKNADAVSKASDEVQDAPVKQQFTAPAADSNTTP